MTYAITFTNGTLYTTLGAGVVDTKLGLGLIGPNYVGYGQIIANNFVRLLENQANDTPPAYPVAGQLWWNTATQVLSYYDGNRFKSCSSSLLGPNPPLSPLDGDQWWDSVNDQLKIWNNTSWQVIGPNYTKGQGKSGLINGMVTDTNSVSRLISTLELDGITVGIVSDDIPFTLSANIGGITNVQPGINLAPGSVFNGTATNASSLGNVSYTNYLQKNAISNTLLGSLTIQGVSGLTVGNIAVTSDNTGTQVITSTSPVSIRSGNTSISTNDLTSTITINQEPTVASSITTKNYVDTRITSTQGNAFSYTDTSISNLINGALLSTLHDVSAALDNDSNYHINTDAKIGFKANTNSPVFSGTIQAVTDNTVDIGTPAVRFKHVYNTSISSTAADMAEKYDADAAYEPGTVVVFGGTEEITTSSNYCDARVAGIISTAPGYTMNDNTNGLAVALVGKVPCKVIGPVKKGDLLVTAGQAGVASALLDNAYWVPGCTIGKSLVNDSNSELRVIMVAVGRF